MPILDEKTYYGDRPETSEVEWPKIRDNAPSYWKANGGNLWVLDNCSRIVKFSPPVSNGMSAALVIGQPGFNSCVNATSQSGQTVTLYISQIITALTLASSGATFVNTFTAWVANDCYRFVKLGTTWTRIA